MSNKTILRPDEAGTTFGRNVRRLREARDWTREELARQAGITGGTVRRCEAGKGPNLRSAVLLARALGVTLDEMLAGAFARTGNRSRNLGGS